MSRAPVVLMVGPLPPPAGGMANQTRQLAALLREDGVDVRVVRTNAPYAPAWVARVPGVRALFRLVPYLARLWQQTGQAEIVHVMANSGWAWFLFAAPAIHIAALRKVPVLVNYRGGLAEEFLAKSSRRVLPTLRRAGAVVVPSNFLREIFGRHDLDTVVIPNIIDHRVFAPAGSQGGEGSAGPHVVVSRALEAIYGIDTALNALALAAGELPGLRISIAGTGPDRQTLEALAARLGIADRVRFTGRLEVAEMAALYHSASLVLNPSRADNMPNSVLEALACGVPVVSTNVGGVPYMVEHGRTAWLVPPDEPAVMARGVVTVLTDHELGARLRSEGLALARQCGWPEVRQRWLSTYHELAA